jgi:hypothetical protein
MGVQKASGTENLRANAKVLDAADDKSTPGGKGKDAGGDTTGHTVLSSPGKSAPSAKGSTPRGVQTFDGEAT